MGNACSFTIEDFSRFLGISASQFPEDCKQLLLRADLSFRRLEKDERDKIITRVLRRIDSPELTSAGKESKERWERGWNENLRNFIASGYDIQELVPKYIHPKEVIRLDGDYALPLGQNFELEYYNIFRRWLFRTYLAKPEVIYEFGCGTGYNVIELSQLYPKKEVHGLDWVSGPKEILRHAKERYGYNVQGHIFDMFNTDQSLVLPKGAAILAIGALEQLGTNFEPFLEYILSSSPSIFVHVDSIIELYDADELFDQLVIKFDRRRNYLDGYLTRLRQLEAQGKIEILKTQRSRFGSLYHDGYSLIVWKPK